jgi:tetratricopeptide (TPR) repeat protein
MGRAALELNASENYAYVAMASAVEELALYRLAVGQSPLALTEEIVDYASALAATDPTNSEAPRRRGAALSIEAAWNPRAEGTVATFAEAVDLLRRAIELNPANAEHHRALAEVQLRWARCELLVGRVPNPQWTAGFEAADAALRENGRLAAALAVRGELLLQRAEHAASSDRGAADFRDGERALREALAMNPLLKQALASALTRLEKLRPNASGA